MAIELSQKTQLALDERNLTPNIILEIDGVDKIYGALNVTKIPHFDEDNLFFDLTPDLYWDGVIVDSNSRDYISLSGSCNTLSQQLLQDKGSAQSVTTFQVELIDKNEEITQLVTPGVILDEIIGVKARLYLNFKDKGTTHPEDSILFHRGIISKVQTGPASVSLTISSPERQKRQKVFINQKAVLSAGINAVVTTIPVISTEGFFLPSDSGTMRSFFQIGDEVIEYTSFDATNFYGCVRGSLGTVATTHNIDDEASSIYRLEENCINMALKLMLSGGDSVYTTNNIKQFNFYTPTDSRRGVIFFNYYDIREKTGIGIGDKVDVSSSGNSNDASNLVITGYGKNDYGSWIE